MKRLLLILFIITVAITTASAQEIVPPNKPYLILNSTPGYVTINNLTAGFGLGDTSVPLSKSFFGFTTIHGYQINKNFIIGGGTGVSFYNGGTLIPLFMDVRFRYFIKAFTPYLFGDGGFLFNVKGGTKSFMNPGVGVIYAINYNVGIDFGTGLFVQQGSLRDSFINLKLGVFFKPRL